MVTATTEAPPVSPALLRRLEWRLRRPVQTMLTGNYRSAFRGRGMEFDQVVKYAWGDDLRDVDWNVSARLGELYRKKFVEEREISVLLVFEDSLSLRFGSADRSRRDTLLELAATLLLLGATNRDRVGLLYGSPHGFWFRRPLPGRDYARRTAALLLGEEAPALDGPARVDIPWRLALRGATARSVVVWLGPFDASPPPEEWPLLARRHQMVGFRADDPWDAQLPSGRHLTAYDPLAGEVLSLRTGAPERAAHAQWRQQRDGHFEALFPNIRDRRALSIGSDVFPQVVEFFNQQGAAGHASGARAR
jgi:uncharacterized protein (DUF58 family)